MGEGEGQISTQSHSLVLTVLYLPSLSSRLSSWKLDCSLQEFPCVNISMIRFVPSLKTKKMTGRNNVKGRSRLSIDKYYINVLQESFSKGHGINQSYQKVKWRKENETDGMFFWPVMQALILNRESFWMECCLMFMKWSLVFNQHPFSRKALELRCNLFWNPIKLQNIWEGGCGQNKVGKPSLKQSLFDLTVKSLTRRAIRKMVLL